MKAIAMKLQSVRAIVLSVLVAAVSISLMANPDPGEGGGDEREAQDQGEK